MTSHKLFTIIKYLSAVGILLAVYLLWEQLFHPPVQVCKFSSTVNCDAIISGAVSKTLGLPTPLYGLIGYIVILISALYKKKKAVLAVSAFGLAFCLWIAYQELFLLHVICPICILCQIVMISIFTLAIINIRIQNKK